MFGSNQKKFRPDFSDLIDNKETEDKTQILETRNELYQYMNRLPTNLLFDAGLRHIFVGFKFDKDTNSQCEYPLGTSWSRKWRNLFN